MSKVPAKVLTAIENASGQSECNYCNDEGKPECVIAQLGVLHGIDPSKWMENESIEIGNNLELSANELGMYPFKSLSKLQGAWDDGIDSVCGIGFNYGETNAETMAVFAETLDW